MQELDKKYKKAKRLYDRGDRAVNELKEAIAYCLDKLERDANRRYFGDYPGNPTVRYYVAESGNGISRPFINSRVFATSGEFDHAWDGLITSLNNPNEIDDELVNEIDKIIYTSIMAFSLSYDIWKPKSRKTPGTFFEVLIGSLFRHFLPDCELSKFIKIEPGADVGDDGGVVSTDLVITSADNQRGAVIPLKITTRERVVQPFAHQAILDSSFPGRYRSFLGCVSETQRDDEGQGVKQVCVPGTIKLFNKHLSRLAGLYYCDVPQRYAKKDLADIVPVKSFGHLFRDVRAYLRQGT